MNSLKIIRHRVAAIRNNSAPVNWKGIDDVGRIIKIIRIAMFF
jgi:hypothetical protein